MKKIMIIAGLLSLAILASCSHDKQQTTQEDNTSSSQQPVQVVEVETEVEDPIALVEWYSNYDSSLLGERENTVIFFHSASCGSCRATEKDLLEWDLPDNLNILKVNYDEDSELRKKYEIPKYHHFVQVDENGEMIKKWSGSFTLEDIQEQLANQDSEVPETQESDDSSEDSQQSVQEDENNQEAPQEPTQEVEVQSEAETPVALAGIYTEYDSSLLGKTDNTVLFFHASWCPPCRSADASIKSSGVSDNLSILKVDFDNSSELRQKYGVTSQHTFVQVDSEGNLINKWSGGSSVADIEAKLQ